MRSWRDEILAHFVPHVSKLTLVADPDALLSEEQLAVDLQERGFDLIEFNDSIEFRYAYESQYRLGWDRGESRDLIVALRVLDSSFDTLPYDILQSGKRLAFDLGSLFPSLSYAVVQSLDRSTLDELFPAQARGSPARMGDSATRDYILRHIFSLDAELIVSCVDMLRTLLRVHYRRESLPRALSDHLIQVFKSRSRFSDWPLDVIIANEAAFYAFLQERWLIFLRYYGSSGSPNVNDVDLTYPGPAYLPFDHHDIRVYIHNLFVEGKLTPVAMKDGTPKPQDWMGSGIVIGSADPDTSRVAGLFEMIDAERPSANSRYTEWIAFAEVWAELGALVYSAKRGVVGNRFVETGEEINEVFARWLDGHFASLINLPPNNPAMLHHIARHLARDLEQSKDRRAALIVVDGLALNQWITVRRALQNIDKSLLMRETAVFAWIPTLTSISRQAIFAGKPPFYFPASIQSTHAEGNLWRKFWEDAGFTKSEIVYGRGLGDMLASANISGTFDAILTSSKVRIVGLVVDKVDKIMHGMQLGAAGMHNQIAQWCQGGFLNALIGGLLDRGYDVWLTSDHGNIECGGNGRPTEGVIAEVRGERVRIYPTAELRDQTAAAFDFARKWQPVGLPPSTFPLIAQGNSAFIASGETVVGHGGITIDEVIVPLVKCERRRA